MMGSKSRRVTSTALLLLLVGLISLPFCGAQAASSVGEESSSSITADYGVDCSWPIHSREFKCGNDLLGDRQAMYENFMEGCRKAYSTKPDRCNSTENARLIMSLRQPQSYVNYTETGYTKMRAPHQVMNLMLNHWNRNLHQVKPEVWPIGYTYTNHWDSPTYMASVEDGENFDGAGSALKHAIWDAVKPTIEEWTGGIEQRPSSLYGIRMYTDGAILSPHVDRAPLVSSCIINVAQDVEEDWVLEVYDRQGKAVNITQQPGDMVLYESGSLIHGRPFPLKGGYFANIFIHFEPTSRPLRSVDGDATRASNSVDEEPWFDKSENNDDILLPPYILPNSPEAANWKRQNPKGWRQSNHPIAMEAHRAAATGDMHTLVRIVEEVGEEPLHVKDDNSWQPLHEAVRAGQWKAVKFLTQLGVDKDAITGAGYSPLALAYHYYGDDDRNHDDQAKVIEYLQSLGAQNIQPSSEGRALH